MQAARQLLGCYPKDEAADPRAFLHGFVSQFLQYPAWVAWYAADPIRGLPRHKTFRPSIAELGDFCAKLFGEHQGEKVRARALNAQIDDRKRLPSPEDYPEHREKVVEARLAQLGPKFGIETPAEKAVSIPPLETVMAKYPGGVMAGLKLSPETMKTMAVQETLARLREVAVADDGDAD